MTNYANLKPFMARGIYDYKSFQTKYRNFLKRLCEGNGYELVGFAPNHYCFSCFVKGNGRFAYISISDVRRSSKGWFDNILIRSAKHEKDYAGGFNQYVSLQCLETKIQSMLG